MSDEQDQSESLDDDVLRADEDQPAEGEPNVDDTPADDYPPDRPLGVEDPGAVGIRDDVATRSLREEPEEFDR